MKNILVIGSHGFVGGALCNKIITSTGNYDLISFNRNTCDLTNQDDFKRALKNIDKPDVVVLASAKVGGIKMNMANPYHFLVDNLMIQNNVIDICLKTDIEKFVFLGSSCIYPKDFPQQPLKEEYLLHGIPETTNEGYAIAKIAGLKMIEYINKQYNKKWISLQPCNLVGWGNNFEPDRSHVFSALIKKIIDAKNNNQDKLIMMGNGHARREFLNVKDLADCILWSIDNLPSDTFYNCGMGDDISIRELADMIKNKVDYRGSFIWDDTQPNGMMRKLLDSSKINALGWKPKITLEESLEEEINYYMEMKK